MRQSSRGSGLFARLRDSQIARAAAFTAAFTIGLAVAFAFVPVLQASAPAHAALHAEPVAAPSGGAEPALAQGLPAEAFELAAFEPAAPVAAPVLEPDRTYASGVIARGESLAYSLSQQGIGRQTIHRLTSEFAKHFDFRRAQPGHAYRLALDAEGNVVEFRYTTSPGEGYTLVLDGDRYVVRREELEPRAREVRIAGIVTTNLHDAVRALGESPQLANDFADIFAWDIDFTRAVRPGDEFSILYERLYIDDGKGGESYLRPGRIRAAQYNGAAGSHTAVYFETQPGQGGYYRADGSSVQRQFLAAPVRYARISSRYSAARHHPILRITRPHQGIDYAAPAGTPIWAVADGRVIYKGNAGGFGNLLKIRHARGYVTYYGHLSKFASGLKVGQRVRQKQVVGYVGSTGLSTGPHVCFRIAQDGRYFNPDKLRTPAGEPVAAQRRPEFLASRDALLARLDAGALVATDEAL
jgi:murein DD-endopeptidase MepM/ murein hydrolase activator NlpD